MELTTKTRKYLYWLLAFTSSAVILFSIYALLGGFKKLEVVSSSNNTYSIAGRHFKGSIKSDTIRIYFEEVRDQLLKNPQKGNMCIVNFRDSDLTRNNVHQFIGILLGDEVSEIPSGMEVLELESTKTFKTPLVMHPFVRPPSEKVEGYIHAYAQEKGYELQNLSMEILYPDNSVLVEMFAKYESR